MQTAEHPAYLRQWGRNTVHGVPVRADDPNPLDHGHGHGTALCGLTGPVDPIPWTPRVRRACRSCIRIALAAQRPRPEVTVTFEPQGPVEIRVTFGAEGHLSIRPYSRCPLVMHEGDVFELRLGEGHRVSSDTLVVREGAGCGLELRTPTTGVMLAEVLVTNAERPVTLPADAAVSREG